MTQKRETVGKLCLEAMQKESPTNDARELGNEMTKPYLSELFKTVTEGKKNIKGDFFVVVLTKRERVLANVIRNYFFYRHTCPTPDYDQAVYRYDKNNDEVDFIWVIPSRQMSFDLVENAVHLDKEYSDLLRFVLDFKDGTLFKKAQTFNNEDKLEGRVVLKEINEKK